jgi:WD40 repeat protein
VTAIFVSYSSDDHAVAERFADRLRTDGVGSFFLAGDRQLGIRAGQDWEGRLYAELRRADAVVFLSSPSSVASAWCLAEVAMARSLRKRVFPVTVAAWPEGPPRPDEAPVLALLSDAQFVDLTVNTAAGYERLWDEMRRLGIDPRGTIAWDSARPPYPGMFPFESGDAGVFFGRDREIKELLDWLMPQPGGQGRFVAVVGPSGSGKSSLVRAGLLPRLSQQSGRWRVLPAVVPGRDPVRQLARSVASALRTTEPSVDVAAVLTWLKEAPDALRELIEKLRDAGPGEAGPVLLVIDQAEELIDYAEESGTISTRPEADHFLALVDIAVHEGADIWAVATVRAEFLSRLLQRPGTQRLIDHSLLLSQLDRAALYAVIEEPANRAGLQFDPRRLVSRLVDETHGGDALPLLAFTLRRLVEGAGSARQITEHVYEEVGGVTGALRQHADKIVEGLKPLGLADLVVPTLVQFATVTAEGEWTRRRVDRDSFTPAEDQVIQALVDARLLVATTEHDIPVVDVAHETLLRQWPLLATALTERRDELRLRAQLERWIGEWRAAGRRPSYLIGADRLDAVVRWAGAYPSELARLADAAEFLKASEEQRDRMERERRQADEDRHLAHLRNTVQQLRAQAEQATAMLPLEPPRALASAIAVTDRNVRELGDEPLAFVQSALFLTVRSAKERLVLAGHDAAVTSVAAGPGPDWLVSGSHDGTVRRWPLEHPGASALVMTAPDQVSCVAVSPDGSLIAAACLDGQLRLWHADGTPTRIPPAVPDAAVLTLVFGPDGSLLMGCGDGAVRKWSGRGRLQCLFRASTYVASLAVSTDGGVLAAGCGDGRVRLRDLKQSRALPALAGPADGLTAIRFAPARRLLAGAGADGMVWLWDGDDGWTLCGQFAAALRRHGGMLSGVAFANEGTAVVTGDESGAVRLWDLFGAVIHPALPAGERSVSCVAVADDFRWVAAGCGPDVLLWDWLTHPTAESSHRSLSCRPRRWDVNGDQTGPAYSAEDYVAGVDLAPDGSAVAAVGGDRCLRIWGSDGSERVVVRNAHDGALTAIAWSRGGRIATGGRDNAVSLFDPVGQRLGDPLRGHESDVMTVAFAPDGGLLASGSRDGSVRLWDRDGRQFGGPLNPEIGEVLSVAFNPDGILLAVAGGEGAVRLWRRDEARWCAPFAAHDGVVWEVFFAPSGRSLITCGDDRSVRLFDLDGRMLVAPLRGHTQAVRAGAVHLSGQPMVTAGADGTVRLWEATGSQLTRPLQGHEGAVFALRISADGALAATGGADGTTRLWRLGNWRSWLREASDRLANHPVLAQPTDDVAQAAADLVFRRRGSSDD